MNLFRQIENIKAQIVDTNRMLALVADHPIMSQGFKEKLEELEEELNNIPEEALEPKISLLFSGNSVSGSKGIKASFISKTIKPFQEMVNTQAALVRFGTVAKRGQAKKGATTDLYLTALPVGSFGVELSQLEAKDLFDSADVSTSIKQVIDIISKSALSDDEFENIMINTHKRNLSNLKKLLSEVSANDSILKMESNEIGVLLSEQQVKEAYARVSKTVEAANIIVVKGIFRGLLLDSNRFEIQDEEGRKISGSINDELSEEELISYEKDFISQDCRITLMEYKTKFPTGNESVDYELIEIRELD